MVFRAVTWVYPRASGGTRSRLDGTGGTWGLSPRERGNHIGRVALVLARMVYPRASGGTRTRPRARCASHGLSPRERGNRLLGRLPAVGDGSIPARAGEPSSRTGCSRVRRVYPRASGGTRNVRGTRLGTEGLSPRERGNLAAGARNVVGHGSIPARAGEPTMGAPRNRGTGVYPRASGGTSISHGPHCRSYGLSPRERGNRLRAAACC